MRSVEGLVGQRRHDARDEQSGASQRTIHVDGLVDFGDVALALIDFGPCGQCNADLDGTGAVDFGDVALMLLESGPCP